MKYTIPAVIASVLFTLSPTYAGSCGKGDHTHSLQEMASKYFEKMDANGDEIVTKVEFEASPVAKIIKSFDALEPNDSGEVTKGAFIQIMLEMHPEARDEA